MPRSILCMFFKICPTEYWMVSLKQHTKYFIFWCKTLFFHPVHFKHNRDYRERHNKKRLHEAVDCICMVHDDVICCLACDDVEMTRLLAIIILFFCKFFTGKNESNTEMRADNFNLFGWEPFRWIRIRYHCWTGDWLKKCWWSVDEVLM